jgi:cytochrome c oxidase accessory protein FixG
MNQSEVDKYLASIEEDSFRDHIATVDQSGKRIWIYPKKPSGWYYNVRTYLSWFLLAFLFGMPWIKVGGEPLLLFNVLERRFILFGLHFAPQDFYLFVLAMLILIVFIALFTVVFGRLFCGWVCPQTIFMEMVFRKIEYWIEGDANAQRRLDKAPWTSDKIIKKVGKQVIFFVIAVLVANTFLAYIIGIDEVIQIATEPVQQHLGGFIAMILFSFAFYGVFSVLREQVCVTICPYGRLQGVLLDQDSLVVAYDFERGEPRGKYRKPKKDAEPDPTQLALGDCIDCKLCVQVCPTGIDIRNGTQLECVNCTACMDACDEVMEKIDRPKELIRYDSHNGILKGQHKIFTPRAIAYSAVLVVLIVIEVFLFANRSDIDTLLLRTPGMLYQEVDENTISNLYNYHLTNKTSNPMNITFSLVNSDGKIRLVGNESPEVPPNGEVEGALFIDLPREELEGNKHAIRIQVISGDQIIDEVKTNFFGPPK